VNYGTGLQNYFFSCKHCLAEPPSIIVQTSQVSSALISPACCRAGQRGRQATSTGWVCRLWNDYAAGFPWHPHCDIETITYVLAGSVEHGDSLGNKKRGKRDSLARPAVGESAANLKVTDPRYRDIPASAIPEITDDDETRVRVICGEFWGVFLIPLLLRVGISGDEEVP
jgi:hypothetical protein